MNLLLFNLAMDADDSVHGHTTAWTNALARRCESVSVITMRAGRLEVEDNVSVHSLGKERGLSEPRRLRRFYGLVRSIMRAQRIDACFAHMTPLFTVLFAPVAKRSGIPVVLWYAHTSVTPTLRMAHALADRCLTSTPAGFRIPSRKLFVVGQGVDLEHFRPPADNGPLYDRTVLTVGRITPVKRIEEMLDAIEILRGAGMDLDLKLFGAPFATDDRRYESSLRQRATERELNGHVSFEGAMPFHEVQTAYHAGGLFLNLSETGSIDKAILESMASGCIPVSRNSSFREVAREHGLEWLVPGPGPREVADRIADVLRRPKDERAALAGRMREIVAADHSLDRLSDVIIGHLRELSERAGAPHMTGSVAVGTPPGVARATDRPRVLFVGATRYDLPLPAGLARKWDALQDRLDLRVVARAGTVSAGDDRFRLVDSSDRPRGGAAFYALLARVVAAETKEFGPEVVVCQSPYEACSCLAAWRLRRSRPKLIVELHADWRTATRLYGSRLRRALALPADRAAHFAITRADATRALSPWTARIAEEATGQRPVASFTTYFDLESFTERPVRPLPERPGVAWIGVLQRYKDPEMLAEAWRAVAPEVPEATLTIVGKGPLEHVIDGLLRDFPGRVRVEPRLEPRQIAELLDESTVLAMSSAEGSEGVPRVIMEAFTRGRPAICTSVGGVPDIVEPGRNGLLVGPGRPDELARALIRVLGDRKFAEQLAEGARGSAEAARWAPGAYAQSVREMIDRVMAGP